MGAGRTRAIVALVIGVFLVLLALLADTLGVGRAPGFGWKQALTLLVGLCLIGLGWVLRR